MFGPRVHQWPTPLQQVGAHIRRLCLIPERVRQRRLNDLAGRRRRIAGPGAKCRPEAVRRDWPPVGVPPARIRPEPCIRRSSIRSARWREVDLEAAVWTVPAIRMKAGKTHRVPLSQQAVSVLRLMQPLATGPDDYLFPGQKPRA